VTLGVTPGRSRGAAGVVDDVADFTETAEGDGESVVEVDVVASLGGVDLVDLGLDCRRRRGRVEDEDIGAEVRCGSGGCNRGTGYGREQSERKSEFVVIVIRVCRGSFPCTLFAGRRKLAFLRPGRR
jgi:hypothetical protein